MLSALAEHFSAMSKYAHAHYKPARVQDLTPGSPFEKLLKRDWARVASTLHHRSTLHHTVSFFERTRETCHPVWNFKFRDCVKIYLTCWLGLLAFLYSVHFALIKPASVTSQTIWTAKSFEVTIRWSEFAIWWGKGDPARWKTAGNCWKLMNPNVKLVELPR